ncbi:MAG: hypothetical protein AAGF88_12065 [Pseudomonadota bacterium]
MAERIELAGATAKLYRDGPTWDGQPTATIAHLRCDTVDAGADLLIDILAKLKRDGIVRVLGPMEGDTWHSYRLVCETDGSAPFLMEPTSRPNDRFAFAKAGFVTVAEYFSARAPVEATSMPDLPSGVTLQTWDGENPEAHFSEVHALSSRAFAQNLFYKPLTLDAFLELYMPFAPLLVRELILLARNSDGELLGYLFGIPDYSQKPADRAVILKTYASLEAGLGHAMATSFHNAAFDLGYREAIHALIQDDNRSAERSRLHGGEIFRRYALMGWRGA